MIDKEMSQQEVEKTIAPIQLDKSSIFEKHEKRKKAEELAKSEKRDKIKRQFKKELPLLVPKIIKSINDRVCADNAKMCNNGFNGRSLEYETNLQFLNDYKITAYTMLSLLKAVYLEFKKAGWESFNYTLTVRNVNKDNPEGRKQKALFTFEVKITIYDVYKPEEGIHVNDYANSRSHSRMDKFYRIKDIRDLENLSYYDLTDNW